MKIELKNLKLNLAFSEETIQFRANLYVNGENVATAENEGRGGETSIWYNDKNPNSTSLIKKAKEYCKSLPPRKWEYNGKEHSFDIDLNSYIDDLVGEVAKEKEQKSFEKKKQNAMLKGLVLVKNGNTQSFSTIKWTGHTIESILKHPQGKNFIKKEIEKAHQQGYEVVNTNLPEELLALPV